MKAEEYFLMSLKYMSPHSPALILLPTLSPTMRIGDNAHWLIPKTDLDKASSQHVEVHSWIESHGSL